MDYDFAGLCADQLEKLEKRLNSLHKAFCNEYEFALNVINNPVANDKRGETMTEIGDALRDVLNKTVIHYTEALNKVQRSLKKYV